MAACQETLTFMELVIYPFSCLQKDNYAILPSVCYVGEVSHEFIYL
jgi:hypothetical protein